MNTRETQRNVSGPIALKCNSLVMHLKENFRQFVFLTTGWPQLHLHSAEKLRPQRINLQPNFKEGQEAARAQGKLAFFCSWEALTSQDLDGLIADSTREYWLARESGSWADAVGYSNPRAVSASIRLEKFARESRYEVMEILMEFTGEHCSSRLQDLPVW